MSHPLHAGAAPLRAHKRERLRRLTHLVITWDHYLGRCAHRAATLVSTMRQKVVGYRYCTLLVVLLCGVAATAQSPEESLRRGQELAAQGNWREAEALLRSYLKSNPRSATAVVLHARALYHLNQPFDAALELEAFLQHTPNSVPALKLYAALLDKVIQDDAQAEAVLRRAAELAPTDLEIWQALGHHFIAVKKSAEAIDCFKRAAQLAPTEASIIAGLATAYSFAGNQAAADATFARALRLAGRQAATAAHVHQAFAEHLWRTNRAAESVAVFTRALRLNPRLSDAYFGRALAFEKLKDYARAEADAEAALRDKPERRDAHQLLIRLARLRGDEAKAARYATQLSQLVEREQAGQALGRRLRALLAEAEPLLKAGKFAEAVPRYEEITALSPDFYEAWFALGVAYAQTAQPAKAEAAFRKYLSLQPLSADGHAAFGVLLVAQGRHAEAQPLLARALELDPTLLEARQQLGRALFATRDYAAAARELNQVLEAEPDAEPANHLLLMTCHLRLGERQAALLSFARALKQCRDTAALLKSAAEVLLSEDPREVAAEKVLTYLRQVLPRDPEARYLYAHWLFLNNELQRCLAELAEAVALPGNSDKSLMEIYALAGMAAQSLGETAQAEAAFQKSLAANRRLPRPSATAAFRYVELLVKNSRDDEAQRLIDEILTWSADFAPAHLERARWLARHGQTEPALAAARRALACATAGEQRRAAHAWLARTLFALGRVAEAEEHQRQLEALPPH